MKPKLRHSTTPLLLCLALAFFGCASTGSVGNNAASFAQSPAGKALANTLIIAAHTAATQYVTGEKIDGQLIAANILDGAADSLRSRVNTPEADSPKALADSVTQGAGLRATSNTVAPIVAARVMRQIETGVDSAQAIENVATTMNVAAATARKSSTDP